MTSDLTAGITSSTAAQVPPAAPAQAGPAAAGGHGPKPKRVLDDNGNFVQPGPYSVRASCTLSEDYFLTDEVLLGNDDEILPFLNTASGATEAIVLTGGQLGHLRRDPAATSGWSYSQITAAPFDGITSAAVVSSSTHNAMITAVGPKSTNPKDPVGMCQLALEADGATWTCPSNGWFDQQLAGPIGGDATAGGDIYWYGWTQNVNAATQEWDYAFYRWDGMGDNAGVDGVSLVTTLSYPLTTTTSPVAARLHLDAKIGGFPYSFAVVMLKTSESPTYGYNLEILRVYPDKTTEQLYPTAGGGKSLLWSYVSPDSSVPAPAVLWQDTQNDLHFVDETGAQANLYNSAGGVGEGQIAAWQLDGEYTFALLGADSVVNIVSQFGSGGDSGFTLPIPLVGGVERIYGVPTDPAEGTLFAVDLDTSLSVLAKSPGTGWTQNVTHQDGATNQPVTSWRCKIGLYDTNGATVGGGSVQLATSLPVALWQESGSTILIPGTPATLTTGVTGQATVSIPAAELDTALLTAQPLDASGNAYGTALTIMPNTDVHNFLAGTSSLTSVGGTISGTALSSAQNKTWDTASQSYLASGPTLPALAGSGQSAASGIAAAITHIMSLPANTPTGSDIQSAVLDFTGSAPSFQTSSDPHAYDHQKTGETSWWDRARNDVESAYHGLRHGAISVRKLITSWEQEAGQWTVSLIITLGDDVEHLMDYIINGVEDAIHAISSFIHALGAKLEDFWNWLKNLVLGALAEAGTNAKYLEGWTEQLVTFLTGTLKSAEHYADNFFAGLETDVNAKLTTLQDQVEDELFGTHTEQPTAPSGTGGDDSGSQFSVVQDVDHFLQHSPAGWLLHKIESWVQPLAADAFAGINFSDFEQPLDDLSSDIDAAADTVVAAAKLILAMVEDAAGSPASFNAASMTKLFDGAIAVADDILELLDNVVNTVLDLLTAFIEVFNDLLTAEFHLPVISDLLRLAGVDSTPSILHMVSMVIAFPATLLHDLFGGVGHPLFPFDMPAPPAQAHPASSKPGSVKPDGPAAPAASAQSVGVTPDWAGFGLDIASQVTQFSWAVTDVGLEIAAYDSWGKPSNDPLVDFLTIVDVLCPMLLTIFQFPVPVNYTGDQTPKPLYNTDFSDSQAWGREHKVLEAAMLSGAVPWLIELIGYVLGKLSSSDAVQSFNGNGVPLIQTLAGATNNICSSWYSYSVATTAADKALAVIAPTISNLSYLDSIIASDIMVKFTSKNVPWVKFYIDCFGNFATVTIDFAQALAALAGKH